METTIIFGIIILIASVIIHEIAHGYSALWLGDPTASLQGRLTLNPLRHLEWFGSLILPLLSFALGGFVLGWARPVLVNPDNFKFKRWGETIVALAGPGANIAIAAIFGFCIRFYQYLGLSSQIIDFFAMIVVVNISLAIFNLLPIPPLDGSKVVFGLFPRFAARYRQQFEIYGMILIIVIVFNGWHFISPLIFGLFNLFTGA